MKLYIFPIITFLIAAFIFYSSVKKIRYNRRCRNLIKKTPLSKIGSLKNGLVKFCGKITSNQSRLKAPISQKDCVYYDFYLEEHTLKKKHGHWRHRLRDRQIFPIELEDETGKVSIAIDKKNICSTYLDYGLKHTHLDLQIDSHFTKGGFLGEKIPPTLIDLLKSQYAVKTKGCLSDKRFRFTETILESGDMLQILGTARDTVDHKLVEQADGIMIVTDSHLEHLEKQFFHKMVTRLIVCIVVSLYMLFDFALVLAVLTDGFRFLLG